MDRRHFLAATGGGIIGTLLSGCGGGGSGISSDVNKTALPRFDLLKFENYASALTTRS